MKVGFKWESESLALDFKQQLQHSDSNYGQMSLLGVRVK
jgi:hypothetical protein